MGDLVGREWLHFTIDDGSSFSRRFVLSVIVCEFRCVSLRAHASLDSFVI